MKARILSSAVIVCLIFGAVGFAANNQDLQKIQNELTNTKAVLADVQRENAALKAEIAQLKKHSSNKIVRERDDAIQAAAGFQADYANALDQLQDQAQKNLILQQQNAAMQQQINYLLWKLDGASVMPSPGFNHNSVVMPSPTF